MFVVSFNPPFVFDDTLISNKFSFGIISGHLSFTFYRLIICTRDKYIDKSENCSWRVLVFDT